ncbi:hypothetical protein S7711_08175 [Stachybotrys chartarum IBT 7711]|uniref:Uncharacterized protein n=1 Tax=Stachybotrys chartarum (strain CBS 109288 / IBT 7711) TaxID=1280523 RepID=A0A084ANL5_STACB|nr:hypothetical protein S7711_08175 [Stachybotrys chartarum IBT 7711]KFA54750.1 hypothetical protein S40293_00678 [Stachybotrys chartarum IBT 40293]KFA80755.1 hypothetical protein S40288_05559 [Stachybotrys chartarum IBT 40288]
MAVTSAVEDVFKAFYELFASAFNVVYSIFHGAISIIVAFFTGVVNFVVDVVQGAFHALGSSGKVLFHNFDKLIWVAIGLTLAIGISRYTSQGRLAASGKAPAGKTRA